MYGPDSEKSRSVFSRTNLLISHTMIISKPQIRGLGPPRLVSVFYLYITKFLSFISPCFVLEHTPNVLEHRQNTVGLAGPRHTNTVSEHVVQMWHATVMVTFSFCNLLIKNMQRPLHMWHATSHVYDPHSNTLVACHNYYLCLVDRIIFSTNSGYLRSLSV